MSKLNFNDVELMDFLAEQESAYLEKAGKFESLVLERLKFGNRQFGDPLPWSKTHNVFRMRPGEISVWCGINGHGKSMLLGQVMLWLLPETPMMIASLEMKPDATVYRMLRQASGGSSPSEQYLRQFLAKVNDSLILYDQLDTVKYERILAAIHYCAKVGGVKHIVLDSLMKCGIMTDDYNGQKDFVERLSWAAKQYDIHIHLVHHMRKGESENKIPDKFDVKGAGEIIDQADNLLIVHRNKAKELRARNGEIVDGERDATLRIAKQRHGEWEGDIQLWFHQDSKQFTPTQDNRVMPWPDPETNIMEGA